MNKNLIFCLTICIALTLVAAEKLGKESFIMKPKQKKESRSNILENLATLLMHNAKINPKVIEQAAGLEQILLDHNTILLAQEKNSFFVTAQTQALQEYCALQQEIASMLESCNQLLAQSSTKLTKITCATHEKNITEKLTKEPFILKPTKKEEPKILERLATLLMHNAKIDPKVIEEAARLEQILLDHGSVLLAQEKNSFFVMAGMQALQKYRALQQEISSILESCHRLLTQSSTKLNKITFSTTKN